MEGFNIVVAHDGEQALSLLDSSIDLLLLDIMMPKKNGIDTLKELRQHHQTPVIMLTARGSELDRVLGLELGADDYLPMPFSPRELVARTRALLRRAQRLQPAPTASTAPPADALFSIDTQGQRVRMQGVPLELTRREYQLLRCLLERPGRILSREFLLDSIWGQDSDCTDRTVDTHVKTLRAKLRAQVPQQDFITTHRGMGYSLTLPG
ncbi:MAG: Transcriptional regulatory protein CpxR [Delftia tsuruhatensis]|nr:MAG: Transcriptional regulatory protein CpxR [Delftia tsuruhatensis]